MHLTPRSGAFLLTVMGGLRSPPAYYYPDHRARRDCRVHEGEILGSSCLGEVPGGRSPVPIAQREIPFPFFSGLRFASARRW
jgi:hypothetical protein